jgi:signal transduction histidine kinase
MKKEEIFKPRARLLLQMGDQLIRNESIALLELIKNSYDADAKNVSLEMKNVEVKNKGAIIIEDDGEGMDIGIITNVWMEPGSDYKEKLCLEKKRTNKYNRLPLGEKGIGRFGVHKLGFEIELTSKKANRKEVFIKINWKKFESSTYLKDIPIEIIDRDKPEIFTGERTGTKIVVKNLRNNWDRGMVRDVYRAVTSLCSPFDTPDSFKVYFKIDKKEWLEDLLSWEDIKSYSLFNVNCVLENNEIKKFTYEFTPWSTMDKLKNRVIKENDPSVRKRKRMVEKDNKPIDLSFFKIGRIQFKAFIFDRATHILQLGVQDKKGLKDYLNSNGGIRVYRDGIRVYDYGEPGNDWLNLGGRRVNLPTKRISNNLIIGAIHLEREKSSDLVEKTNREGFIEDAAYNTLRAAILYMLHVVEGFRNSDKDQIRTFYGAKSSTDPVISPINDLREVAEKKIKDEKLKDEVLHYLNQVERDYIVMNETLLRSAGTGLQLSVVIHEVEKIIAELKRTLERQKVTPKILSLVHHLSQIIESYSNLLSKSDIVDLSLKKVIDRALFNVEFRLQTHKVEIIKAYLSAEDNLRVKCNKNFVVGSILNIIDNSLWWFKYTEKPNRKIYISITDEISGYSSIVIADNGSDFTLPIEEITKPFVTGKPEGLGLGLHIVKELMLLQKGKIVFPDKSDLKIPNEFTKGAVIALAFKKEN